MYHDRSFLFLPPSLPSHRSRGLIRRKSWPAHTDVLILFWDHVFWPLIPCLDDICWAAQLWIWLGLFWWKTKKSIKGFYTWSSWKENFRIFEKHKFNKKVFIVSSQLCYFTFLLIQHTINQTGAHSYLKSVKFVKCLLAYISLQQVKCESKWHLHYELHKQLYEKHFCGTACYCSRMFHLECGWATWVMPCFQAVSGGLREGVPCCFDAEWC